MPLGVEVGLPVFGGEYSSGALVTGICLEGKPRSKLGYMRTGAIPLASSSKWWLLAFAGPAEFYTSFVR